MVDKIPKAQNAPLWASYWALHAAAGKHHWRMLGLQRKVVTFAKIASDSSAQMATNAKKVKKTIGDAEKDLLALRAASRSYSDGLASQLLKPKIR